MIGNTQPAGFTVKLIYTSEYKYSTILGDKYKASICSFIDSDIRCHGEHSQDRSSRC